jgi:hypothetical protein
MTGGQGAAFARNRQYLHGFPIGAGAVLGHIRCLLDA